MRVTIDRRVTLQWLFGAMAASAMPYGAAAKAAASASAWPTAAPAPVKAPGYGTDPTLLDPVVPWPKTLSAAELDTAAAVCDTILPAEGPYPAPSKIGIHHFVDEWVSAPYPEQAGDRVTVLNGFAWLESEAKARHGKSFAKLNEEVRAALLHAAAADAQGAAFLDRTKFLTTGAYYTSEEGVAELGYIGNVALDVPDYPGPTPEALKHLETVLAGLNLKLPQAKS